MPRINQKPILFGSWILLVAGLSYAVHRMSDAAEVAAKPPPRANVATVAKRWPEIMRHVAASGFGPANAPYTIVEFGDFQCPQCGEMWPVIEKTLWDSRGLTNLYFVHRPFAQMHKFAIPAAQASDAAAKDGKFWQMYNVLLSHQADLEPGYYDDYAKEAGLNGKEILSAVENNKYKARVEADSHFCDDLGILSTPTIVIRDNKTGKISLAPGPREIKILFAKLPWESVAGPDSMMVSVPAAPSLKS